jgi:hypothetical protein
MFGRFFGPRFFGRRYFGGSHSAPAQPLVPDPLLMLRGRRRRLRRLRNVDDRRRRLVSR